MDCKREIANLNELTALLPHTEDVQQEYVDSAGPENYRQGDTLYFCSVRPQESNGRKCLCYQQQEVGVITRITSKRIYFAPTSAESRFDKGHTQKRAHATISLEETQSGLHDHALHYFASSGEDLERFAKRAATIIRDKANLLKHRAENLHASYCEPIIGLEICKTGSETPF